MSYLSRVMIRHKKYRLSSDFEDFIINSIKGRIPTEEIERILSVFVNVSKEFEIDRTAESNLLRIISAQFDIPRFLSDCKIYPHHTEILIAISTYSNYLTDIVIRNPEYLHQIFERDYLTKQRTYSDYKNEITRGTAKYSSFGSRVNFLRRFKRRSLLQIGVKDILKFENLEETTVQLSFLTKAFLENLFLDCYRETLSKHGLISCRNKFAMIALGKLGGCELNYSSDVDLMIVYDRNSVVGSNKSLEYFELLQGAVQLFIKSSTEITEKGFLYRIDFRLRPDGKYAPLCRTLNDTIRYYEIRGEDWERQMLIKSGFVCGSKKLYDQFIQKITPFVYPSSFIISPLEQIKRMKSDIETRIGSDENIKLSAGGIRDIEFSVQALQLITGGKNANVRNPNTLLAIRTLKQNSILQQYEAEIFIKAYKAFRHIEHFMQLMNNTQTHSLPTDKTEVKKLSDKLGYNSYKEFIAETKKLKLDVRKIFDQITHPGTDDKVSGKVKTFRINFEDQNRALSNLKYLRKGIGLLDQKEFDKRIINRFKNIEPGLTKYLLKSSSPDLVLENFTRIIKSSSLPSIWIKQCEDGEFLKSILKICEFSSRGINLLISNPAIADSVLTGKAFSKINSDDSKSLTINQLLLNLSAQYGLKFIKPNIISILLSEYLSALIKSVFAEEGCGSKYFVAGIGSFGTREMNFASDVDLIFVADIQKEETEIQHFFEQRLKKAAELIKPFSCDLRLRPEGKSAQLVWDIKSYSDYLSKRGRIWEFQSLMKVRYICGNKKLFNSFKKNIADTFKTIDRPKVLTDIKEMHEKKTASKNLPKFGSMNFKNSKGGISTIESILDYLIMSNPEIYSKCFGKNLQNKINVLKKFNVDSVNLNELSNNLKFLRNMELAIQNIFDQKNASFPVDVVKRESLARFLNFKSEVDLEREKDKVILKNINLFDQVCK